MQKHFGLAGNLVMWLPKSIVLKIISEVGGAKPKVPPTGNPSPAPSTRTARTARTTRQINGAICLAARPKLGDLGCSLPGLPSAVPSGGVCSFTVCVHIRKENQWFLRVHGEYKFEAPLRHKGLVKVTFESRSKNATRLTAY